MNDDYTLYRIVSLSNWQEWVCWKNALSKLDSEARDIE